MHAPSAEQQHIIDAMKRGANCVVDACAGSGKSTTVLNCALQMPRRRCLQITYNSALRHDVKTQAAKFGVTNLEVHTYHSMAVNFFGRGHTDRDIREILRTGAAPSPKARLDFEVVFVDESQDMTHMYFHFVRYVMAKAAAGRAGSMQLMVLGDKNQGLYEFKQADVRFLTQATQIWRTAEEEARSSGGGGGNGGGNGLLLHPNQFEKCTLRTSYRVTAPMARFVNEVLLAEDRLLTVPKPPAERVMYMSLSWPQLESVVVHEIERLVRVEGRAKCEDIFVLAYSVSGPFGNLRRLENLLVEREFPVYVPFNEASEKVDERITKGKIVFSTFHSVKGRERKYVFVVNFDNSYFYNVPLLEEDKPPLSCPSPLYVACTRATEKLYLLECDRNEPLEFLKRVPSQLKTECRDFVDFRGLPRGTLGQRRQRQRGQRRRRKRRSADCENDSHETDPVLAGGLGGDIV